MRAVEPQVFLVASTQPSYAGILEYLLEAGGREWLDRTCEGVPGALDEQDLVEFAGRLCYRSWKEGLNPNVSRIRTDQDEYLTNILKQKHGSVLEHVSYSFVFHNVSRVLTHELVRHKVGTAVSQESMRYVRLTDLPFWIPDGYLDGEDTEHAHNLLARMEWFQEHLTRKYSLDDSHVPFSAKKRLTSFMRRFAPDGVATGIMWTANIRTLRHVIEARTSPGAEEEIRLVFGKVARIMQAEAPALFGDFTEQKDGSWVPAWSKV